MFDNEVDYFNYPIVVVTSNEKAMHWYSDLKEEFHFFLIPEFSRCLKILKDELKAVAVVCDHEESNNIYKIINKKFPHIKIYSLFTLEQFQNFTSLKTKIHPLFKFLPTDAFRLEFSQAIESFIWKQERDLLLSIQEQEGWFSIIGQLTREWAHEIRNYIAIISLNAEITISKIKKFSLLKSLPPENMEKIIDQCTKISSVLDGVRELTREDQIPLSFSISQVLESVLALLRLQNPQGKITVEKKTPLTVSYPQKESIWLRSALVNIIFFLQSENSVPEIVVEEKDKSSYVEIRITNISSPLAPFLEEIIDYPIYKLEDINIMSRHLFIGARLVKSMGGEIVIENIKPELSSLKIILPPSSAQI